jgi:hypothetical protein
MCVCVFVMCDVCDVCVWGVCVYVWYVMCVWGMCDVCVVCVCMCGM